MRIKILFYLLLLFFKNNCYSQPSSMMINYEPILRIETNSVSNTYLVLYGGNYRIGGLVKSKVGIGFTFHQINIIKDFEESMLDSLNGSTAIGLFVRYHFPWQVKDKRVGFFAESNLMFADYQAQSEFLKSNKYEYGNITTTLGFEVNFWKYFYLNLGMRLNYFFTGEFYPRARGLIECRIPLNN